MGTLKTILKLIGGLLLGCVAGLVIGALCVTLFTDTTLPEFIAKFGRLQLSEGVMVILVSIAVFLLSLFLLVTLHEAGHLVFGLLSGYRFVSFRIFNLTFIKQDNRLRVKRFAIAGTGGQCLLTPPDRPLNEIPVLEHDRPKAQAIYEAVRQRQSDYLLQGEVQSDLAIMEAVLG